MNQKILLTALLVLFQISVVFASNADAKAKSCASSSQAKLNSYKDFQKCIETVTDEKSAAQIGSCQRELTNLVKHGSEFGKCNSAVGAETEMRAEAECDVRVGLTLDVQALWVLEHGPIAVGRRVDHHDLVALVHRLPGDLHLGRDGAGHVQNG